MLTRACSPLPLQLQIEEGEGDLGQHGGSMLARRRGSEDEYDDDSDVRSVYTVTPKAEEEEQHAIGQPKMPEPTGQGLMDDKHHPTACVCIPAVALTQHPVPATAAPPPPACCSLAPPRRVCYPAGQADTLVSDTPARSHLASHSTRHCHRAPASAPSVHDPPAVHSPRPRRPCKHWPWLGLGATGDGELLEGEGKGRVNQQPGSSSGSGRHRRGLASTLSMPLHVRHN
ncbi:hypothetical protein FRC08_006575 [Ceratobasidium sp. 394]|nr:hypothetical protein FRC08_006575 [Ceratobasidium sp. 394]